ncbi:hypothetical protein LEMLEM_LOCUS7285, partial [Lemmus lemmus]
PGCGRAGHEQACHTSESHPRLAWLTFHWGLVNLRGGMRMRNPDQDPVTAFASVPRQPFVPQAARFPGDHHAVCRD